MAVTVAPAFAVHPGEWLRHEIVEANGLGVTGVAAHLGVTRQAISALLNGRAGLSAEMAIRFEKAFDVKADTLVRMRGVHELANARARADSIKVERFERAV